MPPSTHVSVTTLLHDRFIRRRLPQWLTGATSAQRNRLRKALVKCHQSGLLASESLLPLKSLDTYTEPLLELDLKADYPELRNMQFATLSKRWQRNNLLGFPIYDLSHEHSLFEAALYNFEAWETRDNGFGSGSAIYLAGKAAGLKSAMSPRVFAQRCRKLDLGGQYQQHLYQTFNLTNPANEPWIPQDKHQLFVDHQRNRFAATLQMAQLRGDISQECADQLKHFLLPANQAHGKLLLCHRVKLLGHVLPGVIHFAALPNNPRGKCAVYFPGLGESPLRQYESLLMFKGMFIDHLRSLDSRLLVSQLMPFDYQGPLLAEKFSSARKAAGTASTDQVSLSERIEAPLFEDIHQQHLSRLLEDLDRLAPPAARANAVRREQLLDDFHAAGLSLLTTLQERIPNLKRTLCDPTDLLGAPALFEGIGTWPAKQRLAASLHLLDIAQAQSSGQVTPATQGSEHPLPELVSVRVQGSTRLWQPDTSLYRVALRPPDGQWPSDAMGLYHWAGKTYVPINQSYYEVRYNEDTGHWHIVPRDRRQRFFPLLRHNGVGAWRWVQDDATQWPEPQLIARLSARAAQLSEPLAQALLPLGGLDRQTLVQVHRYSRRTPPLVLDSLKRLWILTEIERFTPDPHQLDSCAELCSSIQRHLRDLLPEVPLQIPLNIARHHSRRFIQYPSADRLVDIDEARWLPRLLEQLYQQLEQAALPRLRHLQHLLAEYPQLSLSFLEDLDFTLQSLEQADTALPLLKKEIERAQEQVLISRAFEGLVPGWPDAPHSDRLAFALFETLMDWPQVMHLEFLDAEPGASKPGPAGAAASRTNYRRLLKKGALYETQDLQGTPISTSPDLYEALWQALPSALQRELGERHEISLEAHQGPLHLKRALFRQAARLRSRLPAVRMLQQWLEPPMSATATYLPEPFAVPGRVVSGLQLREAGIYWNLNRRPLANHAHRHYILDHHRYYPVKWSPEGWRLVNANNPYGFYQPLLQRKSASDPRWTLHHPDHKRRLLVQADYLAVPTDNERHDPNLRNKMFTDEQRQRLRVPKSYRSCLNSPLAYDRVDNARYPLRDLDGQPMPITALYYSNASGTRQSLARALQLLPYLGQGVEVARLYESKLQIRRFKPQDQRSDNEQHLVGRFHVTARNDLASGELLGVYGGMLTPLIVCHHRRDHFTTWVQEQPSLDLIRIRDGHPRPALACLSGDNILSRINTIFEYEDSVPVRQALDGYNVESVAFPVDIQTQDGYVEKQRYFITAVFTCQAIEAGEELRLNHGYTPEQIQALHAPD